MWQPGPDRVLHTWNTNNTITISEDWKNAKLQKLTEEKMIGQKEPLLSDKFASVNGIPTYSSKNEFAFEERTFLSQGGTSLQESQAACMAHDGLCVMTRPTALRSMDNEDDFYEVEYYDDEYYEDQCEYEDRYEDEDTMFTYEGGRVLVPGLVQGVTGKTIDISTDGSIVIGVREEHNS